MLARHYRSGRSGVESERPARSGVSVGGTSDADIDNLARRVIAGEFGNDDRCKRALGGKHNAAQAHVSELLSAGYDSCGTVRLV